MVFKLKRVVIQLFCSPSSSVVHAKDAIAFWLARVTRSSAPIEQCTPLQSLLPAWGVEQGAALSSA